MPPSLVNSTKLAAVKAALGDSYIVQFFIEEEFNLKLFIEDECCAPFALYPGIGEKWSLVRIGNDAAAVATIVDADIVPADGIPQIGFDPDYASIFNRVTVECDWNSATSKYETARVFERPDSIIANGVRPFTVRSKGLRTSFAGTETLIADIASRLLDRYENGAPKVSATTYLYKNVLEAGDQISLTSAVIPNLATGVRGVSAQLNEVVSRGLQFSAGTVKFELMKVG
jgi:hypothetical protein